MMQKALVKFLAAGWICGLTCVAQAGLVAPTIETFHTLPSGDDLYAPVSGGQFMQLQQGGVGGADTEVYCAVDVYLSEGDVFQGEGAYVLQWAPVDVEEAGSYVDPGKAYVSISLRGESAVLQRNEFLSPSWSLWNFHAGATGYYTFTYGVFGEQVKERYGLFYSYSEPSPVPEPTTWFAGLMTSLAFIPVVRKSIRRVSGVEV